MNDHRDRAIALSNKEVRVTDAERNHAISGLIRDYTAKITRSPETARKALIKEGIYTPKGNLKAEFGGRGAKK